MTEKEAISHFFREAYLMLRAWQGDNEHDAFSSKTYASWKKEYPNIYKALPEVLSNLEALGLDKKELEKKLKE